MLNQVVYSSETPKPIQYNLLPDGTAEVWMRRDIKEVTNEEGTQFEYREVMFLTHESEESIRSNEDTWFEYGAKWQKDEALNQEDIIKNLQKDYIGLHADVTDLTDAVLELASIMEG